MSKLSQDIRANVKAGARIPAKVVDILFEKASVRLLSNGATYHKLDVVGGPVYIGQVVTADFSTVPPTVNASGLMTLTGQEPPTHPDKPFKVAPRAKETTIAIYHNDEKVGDFEGINFVDGT
jgi:hypothetical protein